MKTSKKDHKVFKKNYSVAIDTVPLPENPKKRVQLIMKIFSPVIHQIITDAMSIAIGTWHKPENINK